MERVLDRQKIHIVDNLASATESTWFVGLGVVALFLRSLLFGIVGVGSSVDADFCEK